MKNNEKALLGLTCFLGGVVAGFLIAPIKKGIYCGNNNGHCVGSKEELEELISANKEFVEEEKQNI